MHLDAFLEQTHGLDDAVWQQARDWLTLDLCRVAHARATTSYSDVCGRMRREIGLNMEPDSAQLAALLGQINVIEHDNDRPLLSAVVLLMNEGRPGVGFWNISREMGLRFGESEREREAFWLQALGQCHKLLVRKAGLGRL